MYGCCFASGKNKSGACSPFIQIEVLIKQLVAQPSEMSQAWRSHGNCIILNTEKLFEFLADTHFGLLM